MVGNPSMIRSHSSSWARYQFGHSPRIEFAVCSQDIVQWFALTCVLEETGFALVLHLKRGRVERTSGEDHEAPVCRDRWPSQTPSRCAKPIFLSCRLPMSSQPY